ncbi:MAG: hypothetical protein AAAC47_23985 [Pararhizobium sp.]
MPRREVYEQLKHEIEEEFAHHNLERDMKADYQASIKIGTDEHVRRLRVQNRVLLVILILVVGGFCLALGVF